MANIDKELNQIKNAVYGREVRGSIHDGIDKINKESEGSRRIANNTEQRQNSVEQQFNTLLSEWSGDKPIDNAETIAARTNTKESKTYDNLGKRLDEEYGKVTAQLTEADDELFKSSLVNHKTKGFNVWWIDDDGHKGVYTKLAPLLREYGIKMSAAIITNRPHGFPIPGLPAYNPNSPYMPFEQMKELEEEGIVEFVPHSHTHDLNHRYTDMTLAEIHDDMSTCKNIMRQLGWNYKDLVIPFGAHNEQVREVARQYFRSAIDIRGGAFIPPVNQFALPRQGMDTTDTQDIINEINKAYDNDTLIILMSHVDQYGGLEEAKMRAVIEHVLSLGGEFITGEEAITNYGNLLQVGDDSISYTGEMHGRRLGSVRLSKDNEFLADTPYSEFENGITITKIDQSSPDNTIGFPSNWYGTLITYKSSHLTNWCHQTFHSGYRNLVANRHTSRKGGWTDWVVDNYVTDGRGEFPDDSPPKDYPVGVTTTTISQPNAIETPGNVGGIIRTTKTSTTNYNFTFQEFFDPVNEHKYERHTKSFEEWGEWRRVKEFYQLEINEMNGAAPPGTTPNGMTHVYVRNNPDGLPSQSGNLLTVNQSGAGRSYQTFRTAGGNDLYLRGEKSDGTWHPWKKFVTSSI